MKKGSVPEPRSTGGHPRQGQWQCHGGVEPLRGTVSLMWGPPGLCWHSRGACSQLSPYFHDAGETKPVLFQNECLTEVQTWIQWIYFFSFFLSRLPLSSGDCALLFPLGNRPAACMWLGCQSHDPNSPIPGGEGTGDKLCNSGQRF